MPKLQQNIDSLPHSVKHKISVIVPSIGRPELTRAISSIIAQETKHDIEIIVVFDLPKGQIPNGISEANLGAHKVLYTGGGRRGGAARNIGIKAGSGDWVAYLDDDDYWATTKIELQMEAAIEIQRQGLQPVIGARMTQSYDGSVDASPPVPLKLIAPGEHIWTYLFNKRRPGSARAAFPTSTMLHSMSLAREVRWDEELRRHQDWDYLVRLASVYSTRFHQISESGATYSVGSANSVSASSDWKSSLNWATKTLNPITKSMTSEFLAAQTMRYALQARSVEGVLLVLKAIWNNRIIPSPESCIVGFSGILGRSNLQKVMSKIR